MQILPVSEKSGQSNDPFGFVNGLQTYDDSVRSNAFAEFLNIYSSLSRNAAAKSSSQPLTDLTADRPASSRSEDRRSSRRSESTSSEDRDRDPLTESLARATNPADLSPADVSAAMPKRTNLHMQETRMTRDDLDAMRTGLKRYGLSDSDLSQIENRVTSKEGLTWGEFVRTLSAKMRKSGKTTELSTVETQGLQTFFQKLGYSPTEAQGLIKDLSAGRTTKIMEAVQSRLNSLTDSGVTFNATEISAFMGAMKRALQGSGSKSAVTGLQSALSGKLSPELTKAIAQFSTSGATPQALRQLLSQFQNEMAQAKQGQAEQDQSLVKLVGDTLEKAAQRENLWKQADHEAKNQEAVLRDGHGVNKQVKESAEALRALREHAQGKTEGSWSDGGQHKTGTGKDGADFSSLKDEAFKKEAESRQAMTKTAKNEAGALKMTEQTETKAKTKQGGDEDAAWKEFFGKLKTDQSTSLNAQSTQKNNSFVVFDAARQVQTSPTATASENVSLRQMLNQVQNGILSNLGQGRTQLTLQLKPENLGNLSVLLQVKNKEVSAVIRADNAESGKLLAAHLDQIKQALQDQGLKVAKLEVQTGLAGSSQDQSWFGQDGHNLAREQQEALAGMKMRWRMLGGGGDGSGLAQDVLPADQRAILSEPGLHLIA